MYMPPSVINDFMHQQIAGSLQDYVNRPPAQNKNVARAATRADLGIIDQNLDDKIGMEP